MSTSSTCTYGLVVIGSGPAGVHAAAAYVDAGGPGPVALVSADQDPPYHRPPLSKTVMAGDEPPEVDPILDDDSVWEHVDRLLGTRVTALDTEQRVVRTGDGRQLAYDRLVLATGSTPMPLPGADPDAEVYLLRTLEDAGVLEGAVREARSVVVVGSGFIGCEAAASLARRGLRTTLVTAESAPQTARLGEWVGNRVAHWLTEAGVELRTEAEVDCVDPRARVRLGDGDVVAADLVLAAVGVTQQQGLLEQSRLRLDGGRLVVDDRLRTSDPHVWAAGDVARAQHAVAGRPLTVEHWGDAMSMGELAGRNAAAHGPDGAGDAGRWSDPPGFWSEIGTHTLKYSAWGDGFEEVRVVEHDDAAFTVWYADAAGELVGVLTHERDDDYERGGDLLRRRASLAEAVGS